MTATDMVVARYDRWAWAYAGLERLVFQGALQRARTAFLDRIPDGADVLSLGEGHGRFLRALLERRGDATITALDASAAMRRRALANLQRQPSERDGSTYDYRRTDLRSHTPHPDSVDAIATMFVLDQFPAPDLARWLPAYVQALRPGGLWLHADFAIPEGGWRRLRAQVWLWGLYRLFRAGTGIAATGLPNSADVLRQAGLVPVADRAFSHGLIEAQLWRRPDGCTLEK